MGEHSQGFVDEAAELQRLVEFVQGKNIKLPNFFTGQQYVETAEVDEDMAFVTLRAGNSISRHYFSLADLQQAAAAGADDSRARGPGAEGE